MFWVLCFSFDFYISVVDFVFLFDFCVSVVGFVFLFSLLRLCCGFCVFALFLWAIIPNSKQDSHLKMSKFTKKCMAIWTLIP